MGLLVETLAAGEGRGNGRRDRRGSDARRYVRSMARSAGFCSQQSRDYRWEGLGFENRPDDRCHCYDDGVSRGRATRARLLFYLLLCCRAGGARRLAMRPRPRPRSDMRLAALRARPPLVVLEAEECDTAQTRERAYQGRRGRWSTALQTGGSPFNG